MKTNDLKKNEVVYLTFEQAEELVDRIAKRAENFGYSMSSPEKEAMSSLLSDIGVKVDDIIDVSNLADNYAINAEIVGPENYKDYDTSTLYDCLFNWEENNETHYCLSW
jgi:hypothetical protein